MRAVRERPLFSSGYAQFDDFRPDAGSVYIHGESVEDRSRHSPAWEAANPTIAFVRLTDQREHSFTTAGGLTVQTRSTKQLAEFWKGLAASIAYIDMTGLDHATWAPLVISGIAAGLDLRVVYVEPQEYSYSKTPTEGEIFDLSERIRGVSPIPGLASLVDAFLDSVFVPLLGFEGTRLAYIVEQVQPTGTQIVPVIGVPGFRPEYPFHAYLGNGVTLRETHAWHNAMYARANCPFSVWYLLLDIAKAWPGKVLKVAPIGTKPHALGAVLFWATSPDVVELVYDHPVRKPKRTSGAWRTSVYYVTAFMPASVGPELRSGRIRMQAGVSP